MNQASWTESKNIGTSEIFLRAILNEIAIDKELVSRLGKSHLGFTPLRALRSVPRIERFGIGKNGYLILSLLFALILPFVIFFRFLMVLCSTIFRDEQRGLQKVLLVASSKACPLFESVYGERPILRLNINQKPSNDLVPYTDFLSSVDVARAFWNSLIAFLYCLRRLKSVTDWPQVYPVFDWFLVLQAIKKVSKDSDEIFFVNHYDRWAVLFDWFFCNKRIVLMQHGLLPEKLKLNYKLSNVSTIISIDAESERRFSDLFALPPNIEFIRRSTVDFLVAHSADRPVVLIIGQPQNIQREVALVKHLEAYSENIKLLIKPHPLYGVELYKSCSFGQIITEKDYFPRVDLAICFESTLGVEYQALGVDVLWWENRSPEDVAKRISMLFALEPSAL